MIEHKRSCKANIWYECRGLLRMDIFGQFVGNMGRIHNVTVRTSLRLWTSIANREEVEMLALWDALDITDVLGWEIQNTHVC